MRHSSCIIPIVLCSALTQSLAGDQGCAARPAEQAPLFIIPATHAAEDPATGTPRGCPCDCAEPFGVLDFMDIAAFINDFQPWPNCGPCADLAPPFGGCDLADINAFIHCFLTGC